MAILLHTSTHCFAKAALWALGRAKTAAKGRFQGTVSVGFRSQEDFGPGVIPGVDAQRVELSFTAAVLPNGKCAVTDFQLGAASESSRGNTLPSNSSQTMSRGGFTVMPGQRIPQSVSVTFRGGLIFYYLIFSAAKGVLD